MINSNIFRDMAKYNITDTQFLKIRKILLTILEWQHTDQTWSPGCDAPLRPSIRFQPPNSQSGPEFYPDCCKAWTSERSCELRFREDPFWLNLPPNPRSMISLILLPGLVEGALGQAEAPLQVFHLLYSLCKRKEQWYPQRLTWLSELLHLAIVARSSWHRGPTNHVWSNEEGTLLHLW